MSNSTQDHSNKSGDDKLDMQSPDLVSQNFEKLAELFPNCVTESATGKAIDFDLLKQELNHAVVEGNKERYRLEWPGKREAIVTANLPTTKTLRPVREDSVDFDNTENIYIEGDNLEVLKLLQESYLGKIKMIYIDPPYNTGKDFVYKDNFSKAGDEELFESGQKDELGQRLVVNPETSGRYHSDWLSMMYPRLKLARNLLTDDGVILISIDDNEQANLKRLCDEVFGEQNFVESIVWEKKSSAKGVPPRNMMVNVHEYIIAYQKSGSFKFFGEKRDEIKDGFKNPDNDPRGPWRESNIKSTTKSLDQAFTIIDPNTGREYTNTWAFSKESIEKMIDDGRILWKDSLPKQKEFMFEMTNENKAIKSSWGVFDPQSTTVGLKKLLPEVQFENPKPMNLMAYLMGVGAQPNEIILDFFSGSATTAHAVMQLNAEDKGKRKFIMVQIPEACEPTSEAHKAGYATICEIGKERIRRAANKIKEETGADIDYGFRVYHLDDSNMQDVYYRPQDLDQGKMDLFGDNVKPDRTEDDLLSQVMLDWGLPLSLKIEQANVSGKKVFKVAENSLFACFDKGIDEAFAKEIAKEKPLRIVFKDAGFKDDTAKTNVKQLLKQLSPETEMKVL